MNPAYEIELSTTKPQYVMPWVQVQWMNYFRVKNGKTPFSFDEIKKLESDLTVEYNKHIIKGYLEDKKFDKQYESDPLVSI